MILMGTIHDPSGKLLNACDGLDEKLQPIFSEVYLCVSDVTHQEVICQLSNQFKRVKVIPKIGAAEARRKVLAYGLTTKEELPYFFYCDFDRILTWLKVDADELKEMSSIINNDYTILGRTPKAFSSHPVSWQETEKITNYVASKYFNIEDLDVTAGAAILSRDAALLIDKESTHTHTDCEWPKIVFDERKSVHHKKVNGLCFEKRNSSNINSHDDYSNRLKLSQNILSVF